MTTSIQKWGNSQGVRIPKYLLELVDWKEDEEIILTAQDNKIVIEKANTRKNIKDLFEGYDNDYTPEEIDWGVPLGKEFW